MIVVERKGSVSVTNGKWLIVKISTGSSTNLCKVIIKQSSGTNVAGVAEVFDALAGTGQSVTGEITGAYSAIALADKYRIIDQIAITSGTVAKYRDTRGQPFLNSDTPTQPNAQGIYLVIAPTAAGGVTGWDYAITTIEEYR